MKKTGIVIQQMVMRNPNNIEIFNLYMNDITKYKVLTREEEFNCFEELRAGNQKMYDKLIKHNLLFVVTVAKQYQSSVMHGALTLEDLIAEGNIGLCSALMSFDHTKGYKFMSYAVFNIKQHILNLIKQNVKTIRIPQNRQNLMYQLKLIENELEQLFSRNVDVSELAAKATETGLITNKNNNGESIIAQLKIDSNFLSSLSEPVFTDTDNQLSDLLEDVNSILPNEQILNDEKKLMFDKMLNSIPSPVQKQIIKEYYGIDTDEDPKTFKEIGEKYGYSAERVRQQIKKNLRILKFKSQHHFLA